MEECQPVVDSIDGICVGSFVEWHRQHTDLPLLDLRSDQEYSQFHIEGSVHIPLSSARQRSYELPPRQDSFAVVVPAAAKEKEEALNLIREFFLCQDPIDATTIAGNANPPKRRRRSQKPWKVPLVILAEDDTNWKKAKELGFLVEHNSTNDASNRFQPLPRLWQPDSMIKDVLLPLLSKRLAQDPTSQETKESTSKNSQTIHEIWDLGAGAGRDVAFLAEELKAVVLDQKSTHNENENCNFCVVGMDQRYRSLSTASDNCNETTEECILFWKRRGIQDVTRCVSIHWGNNNQQREHENWFQQQILSSQPSTEDDSQIPAGRNDDDGSSSTKLKEKQVLCLFMVRFWNKSLMEFLAHSKLVKGGTLVAVSQFAKPHDGAPWNFDHPKEKNVLERNELSCIFSTEAGWRIVHDNIVPDSDHGRTLIQFVAVKV